MVLVELIYYSDYGCFQKIFGVLKMSVNISLNNASHVKNNIGDTSWAVEFYKKLAPSISYSMTPNSTYDINISSKIHS